MGAERRRCGVGKNRSRKMNEYSIQTQIHHPFNTNSNSSSLLEHLVVEEPDAVLLAVYAVRGSPMKRGQRFEVFGESLGPPC